MPASKQVMGHETQGGSQDEAVTNPKGVGKAPGKYINMQLGIFQHNSQFMDCTGRRS